MSQLAQLVCAGTIGRIPTGEGGPNSFAATAAALAAVVRAKYKAAAFDPEAPKYFLPVMDEIEGVL